jgi:hypothetical protein
MTVQKAASGHWLRLIGGATDPKRPCGFALSLSRSRPRALRYGAWRWR